MSTFFASLVIYVFNLIKVYIISLNLTIFFKHHSVLFLTPVFIRRQRLVLFYNVLYHKELTELFGKLLRHSRFYYLFTSLAVLDDVFLIERSNIAIGIVFFASIDHIRPS